MTSTLTRTLARGGVALVAAFTVTAAGSAHAAALERVTVHDRAGDVWVSPDRESLTAAELASIDLTRATTVVNAGSNRLSTTVTLDGVVGASDRPTKYGLVITSRNRDLLVSVPAGGGWATVRDYATGQQFRCINAFGAAVDDNTFRIVVPTPCLARAAVERGRVLTFAVIEDDTRDDLAADVTARTPRLRFS